MLDSEPGFVVTTHRQGTREVIVHEISGMHGPMVISQADLPGQEQCGLNREVCEMAGIPYIYREITTRANFAGVTRGMYLETGEYASDKLIHCIHGYAFGAAIDLRLGSPSLGMSMAYNLCPLGGIGSFLYVPAGFAWGFKTLTEAKMLILSTQPTDDSLRAGVHPLKSGINWPNISSELAQLSEKDNQLPSLVDYLNSFA